VTVNQVPAPLIVHVVYRFRVGGLENGVVNLVNRLPPQAWRHAIVSLTEIDEGFAARVERNDVRYVALGKGSGHAIPLYPKLFRLFRELRPAIVHTRNIAALEASAPAWAANVPARVHGEHGRDVGDLDGSSVRYRWVRRAFSPFVNRYIAVSPDLARYLSEQVRIGSTRIEQIYNGVDTARFHPSPAGKVPLPGCPFAAGDHWHVGTVGRMETVKDQTNLARAFVRALTLHPEARRRMRLVLVGDGGLRSQVEAILSAAGVRDLAWLPGELSDIPTLLQGLDCFVLPSLAEGVSNTILEAMATALPVIATRVGANGELVQDGSTGQLVPPSDSEALARAMIRYFSDSATVTEHGQSGRQVVERRFSLDRMVDDYHRLYGELVQRRTFAVPEARGVARDRRTSS
jgi:sugar transferase (PEP-CTERM/EpsH1 system associated)